MPGSNDQPVVATDAHVRVVHPDFNDGARMLRRGYNFVDGTDDLGGSTPACSSSPSCGTRPPTSSRCRTGWRRYGAAGGVPRVARGAGAADEGAGDVEAAAARQVVHAHARARRRKLAPREALRDRLEDQLRVLQALHTRRHTPVNPPWTWRQPLCLPY